MRKRFMPNCLRGTDSIQGAIGMLRLSMASSEGRELNSSVLANSYI